MPTLQDVNSMIKGLGSAVTAIGTKKEIKSLPEILQIDEVILGLTSGFMDGNTWLITCTNKRIIFLDKGMLYGLKQVEIPLYKITSMEQKTGLFLGEISIHDGSNKMTIKNVMKKTVRHFVKSTNEAMQNLYQDTKQREEL